MVRARVLDEEQPPDQERECEGAVVEAARALAGERGGSPAVRRVRGEGGARESCRENDSRQYAERRDEDVAGDPSLEGDGEQERQGHEPDQRGQGTPLIRSLTMAPRVSVEPQPTGRAIHASRKLTGLAVAVQK